MATTKPRRRDWLLQHLPGRSRGPSPEPSSQRAASPTAQAGTNTLTALPSSAVQTSTASDVSNSADACLSALLWDRAYDELKGEETTLLGRYEQALSHFLQDSSVPETPKPMPNAIIQNNGDKRREQMKLLVDAGIKKTEKEAKVKEGLNSAMDIALQGKNIISLATQSNPQAALAWAGVSVGLELFVNPLQATKKNRDGLFAVIKKMEWYWNLTNALSSGLFDDDDKLSGVRRQFENQIVDLYKLLLMYQIKSVCSYHRNRGVVFLRDMIKLEDWDGDLKAILDAEQQYRQRFKDDMMLQQNSALQHFITEHKLEKDQQCLRELCNTDPRDEKSDIEDRKGGLLEDSYSWILENPKFKQWRSSQGSSLLWINADPGKGKTMLLSGIIDELEVSRPASLLSFFFCQASDSSRNNAAAVLRGLIWLLARQKPSLISYVREKYDYLGRHLFEDEKTSWFALATILKNMAQDTDLETTYLVIDALDECDTDLPRLLDLITKRSSSSSRIKWLVSSRRQPLIEQKFRDLDEQEILDLDSKEIGQEVSRAIEVYIDRKIPKLVILEDEDMRHQVHDILSQKAEGTFLWVALVIQELENPWVLNPLEVLEEMPPGLPELYQLMLERIYGLTEDKSATCLLMLSIATLAYRPLSLAEIGSLSGLEVRAPTLSKKAAMVVSHCGAFLTVRSGKVYIIHESARDYLSGKIGTTGFPTQEETHHMIFTTSLKLMSKILQRDMYELKKPGFPIDQVQIPDPDPLGTVRYSCVCWTDHLCASDASIRHEDNLKDGGIIHEFLQASYLYWLEALSLCQSMPVGVTSMSRLEVLVKGVVNATALTELVHDAYRFIMYSTTAIEASPLQAYVSALAFTPTESLVRSLFKKEAPNWFTVKPAPEPQWSECLQTLYGHTFVTESVVFSCDARLLLSVSEHEIKIWNESSGVCLQTLQHEGATSALFSHDSSKLVSGSEDSTIKIWSTTSGECLQTLEGHTGDVSSVSYSHDSTKLVSGSADETVKVWASSGQCLQTLVGHRAAINSVCFSPNSTQLASASTDKTVKIWRTGSGECLRTLEGHMQFVTSVSFSPNSAKLVTGSWDTMVKLWDVGSGKCLQTLKGHTEGIRSASFSPDSTRLVSASRDRRVKIWCASSGECLQTLDGHTGQVTFASFSPDSTKLATSSFDETVKLWDVNRSIGPAMIQSPGAPVNATAFRGHTEEVLALAFSHDCTWLASASADETVKIWDAKSGECLQTCTLEGGDVWSRISFDATGSRVHNGRTAIDVTISSRPTMSTTGMSCTTPLNHQHGVVDLDYSREWVRYNGENQVWLPSEVRPARLNTFALSGNRMAIGGGSGRIYMLTLELP